MKAYEPHQFADYDYPQDMEVILSYLQQNGELNIPGREVERQYRNFSNEMFAAGWMAVDDDLLPTFASYLSGVEI